jgi:hypothetical protein
MWCPGITCTYIRSLFVSRECGTIATGAPQACGAKPLERLVILIISHENWPLQELLMGVETPLPPKKINAAAPEGVPPRRIKMVKMQIFMGWV